MPFQFADQQARISGIAQTLSKANFQLMRTAFPFLTI
jgi:hypothetical protein